MTIEPVIINILEETRGVSVRSLIHVVGLGLGFWALSPQSVQTFLMLDAFEELILEWKGMFARISNKASINFAYFRPN